MTSASSRTNPSRTLSDIRRSQARRLADRTVDVGDGPAGSADQVMVVVADPRLVAGNRAQWLDPPNQAHRGERIKHVVHGLAGDFGQAYPHRREDRLGVGMGVGVHYLQHGDPGPGHTQIGHPQPLRVLRR